MVRRLGGVVLAACALPILAGSPALARDRVGDKDVERARDACREMAERRDWRDVHADVREHDRKRERVLVTVRGRRRGEDRERECVYDIRDHAAEIRD
jgi:hypothetical protein